MAHIAIIEDEPAIRRMYALKFRYAGHTVYEADNGIHGLELLASTTVDVVLLDLRMPHMSGDEMLRELRNTDHGADLPVIILTNISRDEAPRTIWHLGVGDFIVKSHSTPQKVLEAAESLITS